MAQGADCRIEMRRRVGNLGRGRRLGGVRGNGWVCACVQTSAETQKETQSVGLHFQKIEADGGAQKGGFTGTRSD